MFKKILISFFAIFLSLGALTSCNTVHGVGQDIEETGEAISSDGEYDHPYDDDGLLND